MVQPSPALPHCLYDPQADPAALPSRPQTGDLDHIWIVGSYFHYSVPGGFTEPEAKDISPGRGSDPMYVPWGEQQARFYIHVFTPTCTNMSVRLP
eukprot:365613-Chlamydomonas_euryale.AAC.3